MYGGSHDYMLHIFDVVHVAESTLITVIKKHLSHQKAPYQRLLVFDLCRPVLLRGPPQN